MAKSGSKRVRRPRGYKHLSAEKKALIAASLVRDLPTKMLKQIAAEWGITYSLAFKILQSHVVVTKQYILRQASPEAQEKPESDQVPP